MAGIWKGRFGNCWLETVELFELTWFPDWLAESFAAFAASASFFFATSDLILLATAAGGSVTLVHFPVV